MVERIRLLLRIKRLSLPNKNDGNLIQIHSVKNVLSHSGCPEDLLESYLQFLQAGGQQVQIVRGEVTMMFQKEMQYRKRRNEEMKGTVTF